MAEVERCLRLDGRETTLVFSLGEGVPTLLHFGGKLPKDADLSALADAHSRAIPPAGADAPEPISLHPEAGRGFQGHPALIGDGPENGFWAGRFVLQKVEGDGAGVVFTLDDQRRGLLLELDWRIAPTSDVVQIQSRITNTDGPPFRVDWLAAGVIPIDPRYTECLSFHGRWCAEFELRRHQIADGQTTRENRRGRTSHDAFPGLILLTPRTGEDMGAAIGVHLGWSGSHKLVLERLPDGDIQVQAGILPLPGEIVLPPGQTLSTPWLYAAQTQGGLNALSQKFHAYIRMNLLRFPKPQRPRPVTVNTWEALYFDHRPKALTALIDAAAEIGAERFVLDDGWFRGRNDDTTSLGDWFVDETKFPDGLKPLADHVRAAGMEFGLWVEPEMVNPDSDLYRAHPDWALGLGDLPKPTARNQLVLDLTNRTVTDYLFARLSNLIEETGVAYLKWDMNRDLVLAGDGEDRPAGLNQTEALYGLIDRVRAAFPSVEIESCASGGGRVDYGILARTHRFWPSDSNDPVERMRIQAGFSLFFPPEVMGAHIGPTFSHTSGRGTHADFRALIAGFGHFGIEADLTTMSAGDRAVISRAIERYKADRALWHSGRFHRIRTADPALIGAMAINDDQTAARIVLAQLDRPRAALPPRLHLHGLDRARSYQMTVQDASEGVARANRRASLPLLESGITMSGAVLAEAGVSLPILPAQTGLALALDAAR